MKLDDEINTYITYSYMYTHNWQRSGNTNVDTYWLKIFPNSDLIVARSDRHDVTIFQKSLTLFKSESNTS